MSIILDGTTGVTTPGITDSGNLSVAGTAAITGATTLSTVLGVAQGGTGATSLTANNVLLGNGTSAVATVAPGASGNVLTSDGTTWASSAGGGYVSLGTITFSGTNQQFSLTGLTLTSYKLLYLSMNGITQGTTGNTKFSISGLTGDQSATYWNLSLGGAGTQFYLYGAFFIDLVTGITIGGQSYAAPSASTSMPLTSTASIPNSGTAPITSISNSSTAIYAYFAAATGTRSGTLTVYGVK